MSTFATNADFLTRYDTRLIAQLVSDTGTPANSLNTDTALSTALADASGEILAASLRGSRYTEADLTGLTGNSLSLLKRLTCDLAVYYLVLRRGLPIEKYPQTEKALTMLEMIEGGERVFAVQGVVDAGIAYTAAIPIQTIADNNSIRECKYFNKRRLSRGQI